MRSIHNLKPEVKVTLLAKQNKTLKMGTLCETRDTLEGPKLKSWGLEGTVRAGRENAEGLTYDCGKENAEKELAVTKGKERDLLTEGKRGVRVIWAWDGVAGGILGIDEASRRRQGGGLEGSGWVCFYNGDGRK